MIDRLFFALATGALAAVIASPQTISPDLQQYLNLTAAQVQSIAGLNKQLSQYYNTQLTAYYDMESQAMDELSKDSPDPGVVGSDYAQMEMIQRGYSSQLAQVQSQIAAVLTAGQAMSLNALLSVERLQTLVTEAGCVYLEPQFIAISAIFTTSTATCQVPPVPIALINYLSLTDSQAAAIENILLANQNYMSRESQKITELENRINKLTAASTIDSAKLGAACVEIQQIQSDESARPVQLMATIRGMITAQQQPQLQSLDNALQLNLTAGDAVATNILVLPPDLCPATTISNPFFTINPSYFIFNPPFPANLCGSSPASVEGLPQVLSIR